MNELYINGNLCDLADFTRIGLTKQANNIGELQDRQGDFTNTFKLPKTQRNILLIGVSNDVQSNTSIPYETLLISYLEDGVPIVANGRGVIESIDETINISITAGNISLSDAIGDLVVGDLFEDETLFTWNLTNVINGGSYWNFPLIDWLIDSDTYLDTNTIDVREMLPCLPIPKLFEKLEDRIGFKFGGDYLNSVDHNSMILTPNEFVRTKTLTVNSGRYLLTGGALADTTFFNIPYVAPPPTDVTLLLPIKTNTFSNSEFSFSTNSKFIPATNQVGVLKFSGLLNTFRRSQVSDADVWLYAKTYIINHTDSIVLSYQQTEIFTTQMNVGIFPNFSVGFQTDEMTFVAGKEYRVYTQLILERVGLDTDLVASWQNSKFEFQQTQSIIFGSDISFVDLFRMKVKDVFKDILNLRCLMIQTDEFTNITELDYLNKIKTNEPLDWTDKLVNNTPIVSFIFGKYAQTNWLRFKSNTNVPDELSDGFFAVDNKNLEAEKDIIKLSHPATEQRPKFNALNVPKVKAINSSLAWQKPDYRILQVVKQDLDFDIDYTDGTTTTSVNTQIPIANFVGGQDLIDNYYTTIEAILDKSKVIKLPFRLTPIDVQNIDFLRPIKVDYFGTFYLNKIENFKDEITICELVRL